jgi:membrane protease YdiL (CAAX protease family)
MRSRISTLRERSLKSGEEFPEIVGVVGLCGLLLFLAAFLPSSRWRDLLPPMAFLYLPLLVIWIRGLPARRYGLSLGPWEKKSCLLFGSALILIFPLYILGFHLWQSHVRGLVLHLEAFPSGKVLWATVIFQTLLVAFPEEFFFRGYLQTRLREMGARAQEPEKECVSARRDLWASIVISNTLFAASHLIGNFSLGRLLTFFPGLIFSGLWWRTRNLVFPVLFHALCNTLSFLLYSLYLA